jgi:hypothetical protein
MKLSASVIITGTFILDRVSDPEVHASKATVVGQAYAVSVEPIGRKRRDPIVDLLLDR